MTDVTKYFDWNSKKWNLSGNSSQEGAKKLKGSFDTSRASDIPDEVFTESLKSPDCVTILLPPIRAAEIFEWVRKYMDGISQNLQNLSPY